MAEWMPSRDTAETNGRKSKKVDIVAIYEWVKECLTHSCVCFFMNYHRKDRTIFRKMFISNAMKETGNDARCRWGWNDTLIILILMSINENDFKTLAENPDNDCYCE